jgi:hypothetical protein
MPQFAVLYKLPTFKLIDGKMRAATLVTVRLKDNRVVTVLLPYPESVVNDKLIEEKLKEEKYI